MSSEPRLFRFEHRRYGTLDAVSDFTVATTAEEAERLVKAKLDERYGDGQYVLSEICEASFDDLPDDESAFERYTREMDKAKPKSPERGPFWQFRIGENYRQRVLVYAESKPAAVAKMTERLLADGGRFHTGSPAHHPAVESLTLDRLRSRLSGRTAVFSVLSPQDAREFVGDLLAEHIAAVLNWHRESIARLEKEAAEGELCLPSNTRPPKASTLLLEGLAHVAANAAIDAENLPESIHAGTD
jgi:hypothetical protein